MCEEVVVVEDGAYGVFFLLRVVRRLYAVGGRNGMKGLKSWDRRLRRKEKEAGWWEFSLETSKS